MNKGIKKVLAVVAVAALTFGVTACSSSSDEGFVIAYQGPLSGGEASTGTDELNAVKYAVKLFMAENPDIKVSVLPVDDQGDPAVAATVAPGAVSYTHLRAHET